MENLKDLYFFEREKNNTLRLRYTLRQILFDLVTVPDEVRESCLYMRSKGASLSLKPSFYVLRYFKNIYEAAPSLMIGDIINLSHLIGMYLSSTGTRVYFDKIEIQEGTRILNGLRPEKTKWLDQEIFTSQETGKKYCVQIHRLPNIDNGIY